MIWSVHVLQVLREIVTLERMHRAFDSGLMVYGMAKAVKKIAPTTAAALQEPAAAAA
jgi:MPBQ/MSBQ methyltransferase